MTKQNHQWTPENERGERLCSACGMKAVRISARSRGSKSNSPGHWEYWHTRIAPRTGKPYRNLEPTAGPCPGDTEEGA